MPLYQREYSWSILSVLFSCVSFVLRWFLFCVTGAAGPFFPTTKELQKPWKLFLQRYILSLVYLTGTLVLLLPALVSFILRYVLHQLKNPHYLSTVLYEGTFGDRTDGNVNANVVNEADCYTFTTMNLCLLPEIASKINNLDKTSQRAKTIGERIVIDQMFFSNVSEGHHPPIQNGYKGHLKRHKTNFKTVENVGVITHFSHLDFVCLQETFDRDCAKLLVKELHKVFPWVVYDAGVCGIKANRCGLNSGLMVASRYKITDVDFKQFETKCGLDKICDKGVLMVKVCLDEEGPAKVGYVFNTHLQAFQGDQPIVEKQLDSILEWTAKFRKETSRHSEKVVFDVICGDFNFDNMSPGEAHLGKHGFFSTYVDVCRIRPGQDEDWTVGTELRIPTLQDEAVSTPLGLKTVLDNPYLRQQYVIDADIESTTMAAIYSAQVKRDKQGKVIYSPAGGKRRIDGILYRKDAHLKVKNYHFVTRLASLTDHIPVLMRVSSHQ